MSGVDGRPIFDGTAWARECTEFGADPEGLRAVLIDAVAEAIESTARNLQTEIGPSQIGTPCLRWMAHLFAGTPPTGVARPKWAAAVGTAVHGDFSDWLHSYNERHGTRFLTDLRVYVGDLYPGRPIFGTLDALDLRTGTVIDLKAPNKTQMQKYGPGKPENPVYDVQVDLYGNGCLNAGFPVSSVGILRLPRAGELADATWKCRPHDPEKGQRALARAGAIAQTVNALGPAAIPLMPTAEHFCSSCDYFLPGARDLTRACPGAEAVTARRDSPRSALDALIA